MTLDWAYHTLAGQTAAIMIALTIWGMVITGMLVFVIGRVNKISARQEGRK